MENQPTTETQTIDVNFNGADYLKIGLVVYAAVLAGIFTMQKFQGA